MAVLGDRERAANDLARENAETLLPGYGQTSTSIWQHRVDREYDKPQ
jgi:hypothetical protein